MPGMLERLKRKCELMLQQQSGVRSTCGEYILPCDQPRNSKKLRVVSKWSPEKQARMDRGPAWQPPLSPYGLIQEFLYEDPWKMLVACILLNRTSGAQVLPRVWGFFKLCPTPLQTLEVDVKDIERVIRDLGMQEKRSQTIKEFTRDYLYLEWDNVDDLFGIGKYATDAYNIFFEGHWREVQPSDHMLNKYWSWLKNVYDDAGASGASSPSGVTNAAVVTRKKKARRKASASVRECTAAAIYARMEARRLRNRLRSSSEAVVPGLSRRLPSVPLSTHEPGQVSSPYPQTCSWCSERQMTLDENLKKRGKNVHAEAVESGHNST